MRIGIDFGGVLAIHDGNEEGKRQAAKSSSSKEDGDHVNTCINMPKAIWALEQLKTGGHELYIISFCGARRAQETMNSLRQANLLPLFKRVLFTRSREAKGVVCNELAIDAMIDDRDDVLRHVHKITAGETETVLFRGCHENSWPDALIDLNKKLSRYTCSRKPWHHEEYQPDGWERKLLYLVR